MDDPSDNAIPLKSQVKATFRLGSETHTVNPAAKGAISEQLAIMKEDSMGILKNFIIQHNVPNDVPDEAIESGSEDETTVIDKPTGRPKKRK